MTVITIDTFIARAQAEGWAMAAWDGQVGQWESVTFVQAGIRMTGTYIHASAYLPEGGFCVNLERDRSWVAMATFEDHSLTTFALSWAEAELTFPKVAESAEEYCNDQYCRVCYPGAPEEPAPEPEDLSFLPQYWQYDPAYA